MKTLSARFVVLALALAGFIVVTTAPLFLRARTVEADEPMAVNPPPIDGQRAYTYLKQICAIGPRTAGSQANTKQRAMVAEHFTKLGGVVKEQPFPAQDPKNGRKLTMANLIGSWFPERDQRVVIGAHYDTRPHPDQEDDPQRQKLPFIGADDGGSGVALLMEIAHHLNDLPTELGVNLVLFDGEELVYGDGEQRIGRYFLGSEEFAKRYANKVRKRRDRQRYHYGIVLEHGRRQRAANRPGANQLEQRAAAHAIDLGHRSRAQGHLISRARRARSHGRSPRLDQSWHSHRRPDRLQLQILAQSRRSARELLAREPG